MKRGAEKTKKTTNIYIDKKLYAECQVVAGEENRSCSEVIEVALRKYLERKPRFRLKKQ